MMTWALVGHLGITLSVALGYEPLVMLLLRTTPGKLARNIELVEHAPRRRYTCHRGTDPVVSPPPDPAEPARADAVIDGLAELTEAVSIGGLRCLRTWCCWPPQPGPERIG
jgi:hypothetical protein